MASHLLNSPYEVAVARQPSTADQATNTPIEACPDAPFEPQQSLLDRGHQIWLTPRATIYQERGQLGWGEALRERYVWGRSFGGTRVRGVPLGKRLVYAAFCPALPPLLASRAMRIAWRRGSFWSGCLPVLPMLLLLVSVWSLGEMVGYLSGRPD